MSAETPRRSSGVIWTPFLDGLLLHDQLRHQIHVLNTTGALVWEACDGATTLDEAARAFSDAAGQPVTVVRADLDALVAALRSEGLVDRPELPTPAAPLDDQPLVGSLTSPLLRVLDEGVVFRSNSQPVLDHVVSLFGDLRDDVAVTAELGLEVSPSGAVRLHGRGHNQTFADLGAAEEAIAAQVNRIAAASSGPVAFHAGGVRSPQGQVVALAASSGSGKSTLTAALVRAGWDYLTDEALGVRLQGLSAVGYPKPLTLDGCSQSLVGVAERPSPLVSVDEVRGGARGLVGDVGPVRLVVLPHREAGAALAVQVLSPVDAVAALAENALNLVESGPAGLATLAELAATVPCVRVTHDDLNAAVDQVATLALPEGP